MRDAGELCLLVAFVGSGFSAFASLIPAARRHHSLRRLAAASACASLLSLSLVVLILAWALYHKDFSFQYVAQYSSQHLPWYYSLSALWVGQAGSLLLWAWLLGLLFIVFRFGSPRTPTDRDADRSGPLPLRDAAGGVLMGYLCFLIAIMVFAADPMTASVAGRSDGAGLSPLLQHPAMLIHPPVVFLGYALWTIPFALALVALVHGRLDQQWVRQARPWALAAWTVLGGGILLGAEWAYEELGWGGYWGWDPVENGSLIPWLAGTALIHALMAWQHRLVLKRTAIALALATFGLCNFATFLTRSGIFSSLHAFSQSPIGWLFLALMVALIVGGLGLLVWRWSELAPQQRLGSVWSRESMIVIASVALVTLTLAVLGGTLSSSITSAVAGRMILVGPDFYNRVLVPTGIVLLLVTSLAPLLRWGHGPTGHQRRWLLAGVLLSVGAAAIATVAGIHEPLFPVVIGLAVMAVTTLVGAIALDAARWRSRGAVWGLLLALRHKRGQYAGWLIHLGVVCLAVGIAGSSLGSRQHELVLEPDQSIVWAGRQVRIVRRDQRRTADKLIAEVELAVDGDGRTVHLHPARHFHLLTQTWTTEVAIDSTWRGDFYVVLHGGDQQGNVRLTLVSNPLIRWIWLGGWIAGLATLIRLVPGRRRRVVQRSNKRTIQQSTEPTNVAPVQRAA